MFQDRFNRRLRYLEKCKKQLEFKKKQKLKLDQDTSSSESEEEEEEEEEFSSQTFPKKHKQTIVRQTYDDLTCGMRCIQNLYGKHFITREEMDTCARTLEQKSYGDAMYDPKLGFYSIEVIHAILQNKNKCVQRIDIQKIPSEYYIPAINLNPNFVGYIVSIGIGDDKHYIAVRYNATQQRFRRIDSLPDIRPVDISIDALFKKRLDGQIYCSMDANEKYINAIIAVGHSDFLEYRLLSDTWNNYTVTNHINNIRHILQGNKRVVQTRIEKLADDIRPNIKQWYKTWPVQFLASKGANANRRRVTPSEICYDFLKRFLNENLSPERDIIIKLYQPQSKEFIQTIIRCVNVEGLICELQHMNWINKTTDFWMTRDDKKSLQDEYGDELNINSAGNFEDYNIDPSMPIIIYSNKNASMASVGGFYTFQYKVEGTCIGQQHNAYSIKDKNGTVHILYKSSISSINTK